MEDHERTIYEEVRDEQAYYEEHPDSDEWEEVPAPDEQPVKAVRRTMISVRLSPEEAEEIRVAAARDSATVSEFVRRSALERARLHLLWTQMSTAVPGRVSVHVNARVPVNYSDRELEGETEDGGVLLPC
ncbi:plasmid mobilization protein [Pseudonocardia sp. Cha107L01]|uniref:plasmid mobilization protein n=1 Tax=Pseudonocardia sp. Cha107L01 TaxID=3457576 RepID=UPI00403E839C